jgi:GABA(A) receptor-associated protein
MSYKETTNYETRCQEVRQIMDKYPNRIPIIVEKLKTSNAPIIDKRKYLVPVDLTVGQFMFVIRKRLRFSPEFSLYFFIDGHIPATSELLSIVYARSRDIDGFLYINYAIENTFG